MSEGPIKWEREARRTPRVSTSPSASAHGVGTAGRAYCGRKATTIVTLWRDVTCVDCNAARRADSSRSTS